MGLKLVIFDHDGTLVDSESTHFSIWRNFLANYDIDFQEHDYMQHCSGVPTLQNAKLILEYYDLDFSMEDLAEQKEAYTSRYLEKRSLPLMPFASECIDRCRSAGLLCAVATGASRYEIQKTCSTYFDHATFDTLATKDDVQRSKPAPDVYQLVMDQLDIAPDQCIAIEDSATGVSSALAASLDVIAIPNAYSKQQNLSQATYTCANLREATDLLLAMR